jgi:hypothetical protein
MTSTGAPLQDSFRAAAHRESQKRGDRQREHRTSAASMDTEAGTRSSGRRSGVLGAVSAFAGAVDAVFWWAAGPLGRA